MQTYVVYILTNKMYGVLYVGITGDLKRRITEHKLGFVKGFSKKYNLKKLVYVEQFDFPDQAIKREKQLKWWCRKWKIDLIEKQNSDWNDLSSIFLMPTT